MTIEPHAVAFQFGALVKPNFPVAQKPLTALTYAEVCRLEREARQRHDTNGGVGKSPQPPQSRKRAFLRVLSDGEPMTTSQLCETLGWSDCSVGNYRRDLAFDGLVESVKPSPTAQFVTTITDKGLAFLEAAQ